MLLEQSKRCVTSSDTGTHLVSFMCLLLRKDLVSQCDFQCCAVIQWRVGCVFFNTQQTTDSQIPLLAVFLLIGQKVSPVAPSVDSLRGASLQVHPLWKRIHHETELRNPQKKCTRMRSLIPAQFASEDFCRQEPYRGISQPTCDVLAYTN
ncbi:hypothetical protein CEXT_242711 [Caerostris extrusa]|uniref:Uncharacterized protein n=1 Tax=Caerostris extrusa TaxID=172846 RepID=A0AAV4VBJ2_CAEEX|nr:hypothetical protein CEXT_242711 [Caerostris extrusa]